MFLLGRTSCPPPHRNLFLEPATPSEILSVIQSLKPSNSVGSDGISTSFLKHYAPFLAEPLSELSNDILSEGVFPDELKLARVVPVHKKGSRADVGNYRPISILPSLSKIFEKLILLRLLHPLQFGFRRGRSTTLALMNVTEQIKRNIEAKSFTMGIFADLTKAFDMLDHDILLKRAERYGIRGAPLRLLQNYLSNRRQYVSVSGHNSDIKFLTTGGPQGSLLGPFLFLVYINDLPSYISVCG